ncbi:MAG: ferrous iron transport protein B [Thermodesulfovibrionales bacterium]|nr:ferrous iron transport protein B [Thermodesulfovibrionales bacterium]
MKKASEEKTVVAVAGQPNSGKSTIFNLLTGARQHVANYPGVTVEKKTGSYRFKGERFELVDLPGTYSLTSYSLEERIARDFLLHEKPALVVDIVDASNLERNLYLTFQLSEMGIPLVIDLNMMDIAERRGLEIDVEELSRRLGAKVVPTVGNRGKGKKELYEAIRETSKDKTRFTPIHIDYGKSIEPILNELEQKLSEDKNLSSHYQPRWLAIKLMENDSEVRKLIDKHSEKGNILSLLKSKRDWFISQYGDAPEKVIAERRYLTASGIAEATVKRKKEVLWTLSDRIDQIVCHRFSGPVILAVIIYLLYKLSIGYGWKLTNYTWPLLASFRDLIASVLPAEGFIHDPFLRAMPLWVINGIIAVLNYVPIFLILFTLIAILEDTGYMARMAFILDRIFRYFGLHGQSTLPLILGGVYVGGCAIPGVMACRGIKCERSRMATIMTVPLMNCMAKVPLYVLLISIFFAEHKGFAMFFIATITIIIALSVAKILNLTVLRKREMAPFVMEMPAYHLPTVQGVLRRCLERTWLFVRKVITIIIAVAIIVYFLISFPGLSKERDAYYGNQASEIRQIFFKEIGDENPYAGTLSGAGFEEFSIYWDDYKKAGIAAKGDEEKEAIDKKFRERNPEFFKIVKSEDKEAAKVNRAYKKLERKRKQLRMEKREETIQGSLLGRTGYFMEPFTRFAGFNWRVNIALLSSFAAKESSVATLGSIYQTEEIGEEKMLEERIKEKEKGWNPLHALAIMLFMAMYPPCIPTLIMVRLEAGSTKWMLFAGIYPIVLGLMFAILVFTGGNLLGLSGLQAMIAFYILAIAVTTVMGLIKRKPKME